MPEAELFATGEGEYRLHAPDVLRAWRRDRKRRDLADQTTTVADAVERPVADRTHVPFDFSSFTHGPLGDHIDPGRAVIGRIAKS